MGWDGACYYSFLPATIVHRDLTMSYTDKLTDPESKKSVAYVIVNNKRLSKTTCGVAVMYLPFYLMGHMVVQLSNDNSVDGYEPTYLFFICIGAVVYLIFGLIVLRKILRLYFNDIVTTFTLLSIYFGTNLFYYTVREPFMSHVYSFFLICLLIYYSILWNKNTGIKNTIVLAIIMGLITLIRPTNVIFVGIPIFFNITSWETAKIKLKLLFTHYKRLLTGLLVFSCILMVQSVIWKIAAGSWLLASYGDERFYFNKPHIIEGLFSYRKGWLIYSPIMIFALFGLFLISKKLKEITLGIWLVLWINIYIIFSWWCWWYGGSWGMRAMIDSYALWALPFAAFTDRLFGLKSKVISIGFILINAFFISTNIHHMRQYRIANIHHDSMTKSAFWATFWKETKQPNLDVLIKKPDYDAAKQGIDEYP